MSTSKPRPRRLSPNELLAIFRETIVDTIRHDHPDLGSRQFATMLICYLDEGPHTVRGLAKELNIAKPAVSRSLDRLSKFDLIERQPDPRDARSVLVARTPTGQRFLRKLQGLMVNAAGNSGSGMQSQG